MPVRFKRERNRTTQDVYRNMIRPTMINAMDDMQQKIVFYSKKTHAYQNRTGALENSISWTPAKQVGNIIVGAVFAGGNTVTKYRYQQDKVFYYDDQRRLRVFALIPPKTTPSGTPVNVDYAAFVEAMGLPVLSHGIARYKRQFSRRARDLWQKRSKRPYTFKFTKVTADIFGGQN